ncbi:S1 RNA-binding domain-containing protein, partial [Mycobacterium sp. 050128]|uniref:S1 RNA-binding domain-containing protein n=1 Tax=Mycobacterium sp. 050128 TaxID=3096112 RepID=UPI003FA5593D
MTVGESVSGVVKNLENYGAFVSLGDNLDGLIPYLKARTTGSPPIGGCPTRPNRSSHRRRRRH